MDDAPLVVVEEAVGEVVEEVVVDWHLHLVHLVHPVTQVC